MQARIHHSNWPLLQDSYPYFVARNPLSWHYASLKTSWCHSLRHPYCERWGIQRVFCRQSLDPSMVSAYVSHTKEDFTAWSIDSLDLRAQACCSHFRENSRDCQEVVAEVLQQMISQAKRRLECWATQKSLHLIAFFSAVWFDLSHWLLPLPVSLGSIPQYQLLAH